MAINNNNVMSYLTLMLLVVALCALIFPTDTQATSSSSLNEKYGKCESEFWYKNLSHFKKSLKLKCLKENHHQRHKHYRRPHKCNHNNKKVLLSKWEKFSDCRCESALIEMKDSKVSGCYQVARFNKATGEFLGQLSIFKKKSYKHHFNVAIKFSHDLKLLNHHGNLHKSKEGYYLLKKISKSHKDDVLIERYFIHGKISKKESMNKVSLNRITPSHFLLIDDNEKSRKVQTLPKDKVAIIPFSKFLLTDNVDNLEKSPNNSSPSQQTPPETQQEPKNSSEITTPAPNDPQGTTQSPSPNDLPGTAAQPPSPPTNNGYGSQNNYGNNNGDTSSSDTTSNTNNNDVVPNSNTLNTEKVNPSVASPNQQEQNQKQQQQQQQEGSNQAYTGGIVFGCIVAVGAAFVGYNTYERVKWRRHYRRRQAVQQQNASLANVPDYNGYGRAY
ncbi:hypothetical protein C1645_768535 [Glomus cerebriforme]|uniref:Uncharacterized protein n=1 Tax=Glomus cerebriforme TaxID=658196 RepID=A0A397T2B4_9GLOM|nr:hypothetical protein C1645_768535 [Glomus cerebriforme]